MASWTTSEGVEPGGRHYTLLQIVLHWLVALLVGAQWLSADAMSDYFRLGRGGPAPGFPDTGGAQTHALIGALILLTVAVRLFVRLKVGTPPLPADMPKLMRLIAHADHYALYATLLLLPVTGMLALYVTREAGDLHELLKTLLLALIALHVSGALFHAFVRGDGIVQRMLWPNPRS